MTVMTAASARLEADYNTLTEDQQQHFDRLMRHADKAGPVDYPHLMGRIADLVRLPEGDLRKCACSCYCPAIFDADAEDAHVIEHGEGYNLGRVQCPLCADRHIETA